MIGKFEVIDEKHEDINFKSGRKRVRRLAMQDLSRPALLSSFQWEPSEDDAPKLPPAGKVVGQELFLGVKSMAPGFGNLLHAVAVLLTPDEAKTQLSKLIGAARP